MRRLIVSDIHGNLEALEAVLRDARGEWDQMLCLGDLVGYGASPREVVSLIREQAAAVVRGNHDRVCAGLDDDEWFNDAARRAVRWTRAALDEESLHWLSELPSGPLYFEGFEIAHGAPYDEDEYLVSDDDVDYVAETMERPLCFVGHTHLQRVWDLSGVEPQRLSVPGTGERELRLTIGAESVLLVNPGSVGQPRDRDARAAYALWDSDARELILRRVEYDIAGAQRRIREAGLPDFLAARLAHGQ